MSEALALVRFETPGYLVLLALVPLLVLFSLRSLSGLGRWRQSLAILTRCAVVAAAVLALAGAQRVRVTKDLHVIFVADVSNSIPAEQRAAHFDVLRRAEQSLDPQRDKFGVITFNGESSVEQMPDTGLGITQLSTPPRPDQTNIAAALRMAAALFTSDAARRVVLISDGNENVGNALEEADQFRAAGVPIDVIPVQYEHGYEVVFDRLSAPPTATADETVNLQMVLRSQQRVRGRVLLYHNEQLVDLDAGAGSGYPVELEPGPNRFQVPIPLRYADTHRFRAVFEPDDAAQDTITGNNEGRAFTVVSGQGKVLILTTPADRQSATILAQALEREKLICDVSLIGEQTLDQLTLLNYSLVVLSNVARNNLTEEEERALTVWVRELGGGFVMVGGDESFGAGGWLGSPVEEIMPVTFDIKTKRQMPKGALVLVMHACEIPQGNYWGERVAIESVKTLSSRDMVGVLQYAWHGGEQGYWAVPYREVGDKVEVVGLIKKMQMGDMPDFDAVMRAGVDALAADRSVSARHMIVISDFDPAPPSDALLKKMQDHKITCSTVAIGFGGHPIDVNKATMMAQVTGGKYYATNDPQKLPQIFIKEAQVVRRSLINEVRFQPRKVPGFSPVVAGVDEALPTLDGYVLSSARPLAQVPIVRNTEDGPDPILAHWQVGLGKTVAFTSGMWPRWGTEWAAWPGFSKLWAQIARWASRQSPGADFNVSVSAEGGRARIRVDALDKNAAAINFMTLEGTLIRPNQQSQALRLTQTGPGVYESDFDARDAGSYVVNLRRYSNRPDEPPLMLQTGLSIAYSPELRELRANEPYLTEIAQRSAAGRVLPPGNTPAVFDRAGLPRAEARRSIWEDLIRLMLALFLLDVAIRRVAVNPAELVRKLRRRIAEAAMPRQAAEASAATLATLKGTRATAREAAAGTPPSEAGPAPDRAARYDAPVSDAAATKKLSDALGGASETDAPVVARPTRKSPAQGEADYTSRLLKAKRKARGEMEDESK